MSLLSNLNNQPESRIGVFESMLSGVASGLIAIPKGFFSLGASLMDLGVNSGKAAELNNGLMTLQNLMRKQKRQLQEKLQN